MPQQLTNRQIEAHGDICRWISTLHDDKEPENRKRISLPRVTTSSCDMMDLAANCVQRNCELYKKAVSHVKQVETRCMDDHQMVQEDFKRNGELSAGCAQLGLLCLYLGRRPDNPGRLNILARSVTTSDTACDARLARPDHAHLVSQNRLSSILCRRRKSKIARGSLFREHRRRFARFKINHRWNVVHPEHNNSCEYLGSVRNKRQCHVTQQRRNRDRRIKHGRFTR